MSPSTTRGANRMFAWQFIAEHVREKAIAFSILFLACVPPTLVVLDRWFDVAGINERFMAVWCYPTPSCKSVLPAYFTIVLPIFVLLLLLFILRREEILSFFLMRPTRRGQGIKIPSQAQRRAGSVLFIFSASWLLWGFISVRIAGRLPGWNFACAYLAMLMGLLLKDIPLPSLANRLRRDRFKLALLLCTHISLVGLLASLSKHTNAWQVYLPILLASLVVFRKHLRDVPASVWVSSIALIIFTMGINGWYFSIIGDEYAFFRNARRIVEEQPLTEIGARLFHGQGVYQTHPYLSSLIQAVFMKIFGVNNFGWRFSNIYLVAMAIGLLHTFISGHLTRRVANFSALLLAFSHYLLSFGKIGYNNLQAFFTLALVLYVGHLAISSRRASAFAFLGSTCGVCFYVYPAALYVPVLAFLLLLCYHPPTSRAAVRNWGVVLLFALILLLPLVSQSAYWLNKLPGTFLYTPALSQTPSKLAYHLSSNILSATFSFLYAPQETHFVAASYIDPLSAALALLGLAMLLPKYRSHRFLTFLFAGFVYLLFTLGATHDRTQPSTTRMFLLLPWFAVFAAGGFHWITERFQRCKPARPVREILTGAFLIAILGLNIYQAFPLSQKHMARRYHSFQVLFLREAADFLSRPQAEFITIVIVNKQDTHLLKSLYELLDVYQVPFNEDQLIEVVGESAIHSDLDRELLSDAHSLVIITPWVYAETRSSIERILTQSGKQSREIKNAVGDTIYTMWELTPQEG